VRIVCHNIGSKVIKLDTSPSKPAPKEHAGLTNNGRRGRPLIANLPGQKALTDSRGQAGDSPGGGRLRLKGAGRRPLPKRMMCDDV
jgi:hypothetical protein